MGMAAIIPFCNCIFPFQYVKSVSIGGKSGNYFKDRFSQMIQILEKLYFLLAAQAA